MTADVLSEKVVSGAFMRRSLKRAAVLERFEYSLLLLDIVNYLIVIIDYLVL
jgi:hypothetical protein